MLEDLILSEQQPPLARDNRALIQLIRRTQRIERVVDPPLLAGTAFVLMARQLRVMLMEAERPRGARPNRKQAPAIRTLFQVDFVTRYDVGDPGERRRQV